MWGRTNDRELVTLTRLHCRLLQVLSPTKRDFFSIPLTSSIIFFLRLKCQIPSLLDEEELQNIISLLRSLGFLVEGAPKGNYDVELVMSQYKSCSVFKRYYVPLMTKLPEELKVCR